MFAPLLSQRADQNALSAHVNRRLMQRISRISLLLLGGCVLLMWGCQGPVSLAQGPCQTTADCFNDQTCVAGRCAQGHWSSREDTTCKTDTDCPDGGRCESGSCLSKAKQPVQEGESCLTNQDCAASLFCEQSRCTTPPKTTPRTVPIPPTPPVLACSPESFSIPLEHSLRVGATDIHYVANGTLLATIQAHRLYLWELKTGSLHGMAEQAGETFLRMWAAPDQHTIAINAASDQIFLYDLQTKKWLKPIKGVQTQLTQYYISNSRTTTPAVVAFTADSKSLWIGEGKRLRRWSLESNTWTSTITLQAASNEAIEVMAIHPGKKWLVAGLRGLGKDISTSFSVGLWDMESGQKIRRLDGEIHFWKGWAGPAFHAERDQFGLFLLKRTCCDDSLAIVWDLSTGKQIHQHKMVLHTEQSSRALYWNHWLTRYYAMTPQIDAPAPGLYAFAANNGDATLVYRRWSSAKARLMADNLSMFALHPDLHSFAMVLTDGSLLIRDNNIVSEYPERDQKVLPNAHFNQISSLFFHADGATITTASHNVFAQQWRLAQEKAISTKSSYVPFVANAGEKQTIFYSRTGRYMVHLSRTLTQFPFVWTFQRYDLETQELHTSVLQTTDKDVIYGMEPISFLQDGQQLLLLANNSRLMIWDFAKKEIIHDSKRENYQMSDIWRHIGGFPFSVIHPNGTQILLLTSKVAFALRDLATGKLLRTYTVEPYLRDSEYIWYADLLPGGNRLLLQLTQRILVLDLETGKQIYEFAFEGSPQIGQIAIHPGTNRVAAFSKDADNPRQQVLVWSLETGRRVASFLFQRQTGDGEVDPLHRLAWRADGRVIAMASRSGYVEVNGCLSE